MIVVNSWLWFKKVKGSNMTLTTFREQLSVTLCLGGTDRRQGKGRRSNELVELQKKQKKKFNSNSTSYGYY